MATVASQLTRIHDVEGSLSLTSIGGGAGGGANSEIVIQGAQSAGRKQSNATDHGFWLQVGTQDISGAGVHVGIWVNHIHYAVLTKLAARLGSTTANYHEHSFPLATYPALGGWVRMWMNVARTPDASAGTFNKTSLTQVALLASLPSVAGNAPNLIMDASDHTTTGLLLTGTSGLFSDFVTADEGNGTNKYGVVVTNSGVIFCLARLTLGSASSLVFSDSGFVIVFPDQSLVADTFMGLSADLQHASTSITLADGVIKSSGAKRGDLVVTGTSGSFTATGVTLDNLRIVTLTAGCTLTACIVQGSGLLTQAEATLTDCTIKNASGAVAVLSNDPSKISGTAFTSAGTGHAIEITTPGTYSFVGNTFSGYGADDTTDAAVFNNSGGLVTLNISGGGVTPTVRNGTGASTVVNSTVSVTVTPLAAGSEVRAYRVSDGVELDGVEFSSGSSHVLSLPAGVAVNIVVLNYDPPKVPVRIENVAFAVDQNLNPFQQDDRNFSDPD